MADERKPQDELPEDDDHLVVLQDENGKDVTFEHLMTVAHEGANYILLEATQDMEDCLQGESIILKIEQDENGDDLYATIEDEAEYEAVFEKCMAALEEQEDEDEDEGDGGVQ